MLKIDKQHLTEAIKAFYITTGIKIALYDADFTEITAYPETQSHFCTLMHSSDLARSKCHLCTSELFRTCSSPEHAPVMHKCHAGLTEVACPLTDHGTIIGYAIFGQITDEPDRELFMQEVLSYCTAYNLSVVQLTEAIANIRYYSKEQLQAISFLLNITVSYILSNRLAYVDAVSLGGEVRDYILHNLSEDLSISNICTRFFVSRSMLYKLTASYMPEGILAFIKKERLLLAKELLRNTEKTLPEIVAATGFHDVAYFQRTFKKETGISVSRYRKEALSEYFRIGEDII